MKKIILAITSLVVAFGFIFEMPALANNKPRVAWATSGFFVCYRPVKVFHVAYDRYGYKYSRYLGMKNMCTVTRVPCSRYSAHRFGWYSTYHQAKYAGYRCNHYWY